MSHYTRLLLPHLGDPLAVLVFFLIVGLWLAAFTVAWRARRSHAAAKLPPDAPRSTLEEWDTRLVTVADRFAEAAPSLLIMVGLLGTFVGIAAAIGDAQDALRAETGTEVSEKLGGMLRDIGLKFRSSAWGLLGFLTLRPLVHVIATQPRRHAAARLEREAHEEAGRAREAAEKAIRHAERARQREDEESWRRRDEQFAAMVASLGVLHEWGPLLQAFQATAGQTAESAATMKGAAQELTKTMAGISAAVQDAVKTAGERMDQAVATSAAATLEALQKNGAATLEAVQKNGAAIGSAVAKLDGLVGTIQTSLSKSLDASQQAVTGALEKLAKTSGETVRELQATNEKALDALSVAQKAGSADVKDALGKVAEMLRGVDGAVGDIRNITAELTAAVETSSSTNGKLQVGVSELRKSLGAMAGDMAQASKVLENVGKRLAAASAAPPPVPPPAAATPATGAAATPITATPTPPLGPVIGAAVAAVRDLTGSPSANGAGVK